MLENVLDHLPPKPALSLFFQFAQSAGLEGNPKDRKENEEGLGLMSVARFVAAYVVLKFFGTVGIFYNFVVGLSKAGLAVYNQVTHQNPRQMTTQALQHGASLVADYFLHEFATVCSVIYAFAPGPLHRTHKSVTDMIAQISGAPAPASHKSHKKKHSHA